MTLEERIAKLRQEVNALKALVDREAGQLEAYKNQRATIVQKCEEKGFEPIALETLIAQARLDLESLVQNVEEKLSGIEEERRRIIAGVPAVDKS